MGYSPFSGINLVSRIIFLFIFLLAFDAIVFLGAKYLFRNCGKCSFKNYMYLFHWLVSIILILLFLIFYSLKSIPCKDFQTVRTYYVFFAFFLVTYFPKIIFSVFFLSGFIIMRFCNLLYRKKTGKFSKFTKLAGAGIVQAGGILSILVFLVMIHGMLVYRFDYKVIRQEVYLENLPSSFNNYRIVQISDMHLGSMSRLQPVEKLARMINELHPDMLVFTGDMVNILSEEAIPFIPAFRKLDPTIPKFSIFGNHDFADYAYCMNDSYKTADKRKLVKIEEQMGFHVLLNESLVIKKNGDSFALIGVENWGQKPYKKYGDLEKAMKNVKNIKTKILLSHDPEHWTFEVAPHYDIDLTLSGHTHAMQFGIKIGHFKWSPIQYKYPNWNGLYQSGKKQQYVNRGVGYLGFPGRIGLRPEITLIVLKAGSGK